jgi:hypothetical protein
MPTAVQTDALLDRAVLAVRESPRIDAAVNRLAGALFPQFYVARASVRMHLAAVNEVVIVALWCAHPSRLGPGTRMRASSTSCLDVVLQKGVVCGPRKELFDVAEDVMHEGSIKSWASVPLPPGARPAGVLTIASASERLREEKEFFTLLGSAVGNRLAQLAKASPVYMHALDAAV